MILSSHTDTLNGLEAKVTSSSVYLQFLLSSCLIRGTTGMSRNSQLQASAQQASQ
jgi:hypothetical protein